METAILEAASAAWASLSAVAIIILGLVSMTGGRSRAPGSFPFGCAVILWGLHVLVGRWMAFVSPDSAAQAHLLYSALILPIPYFLVQFSRAFAREGATRARWRVASALSIALPLACLALVALAPETIYLGASVTPTSVSPRWGPLHAPLVFAPFFGSLALALVALDGARRASTTGRTAIRHALMCGGLALPVAFIAGNNTTFYGADLALGSSLANSAAYFVLFVALSVVVLVVGVRSWLDARAHASAVLRRAAATVALAVLVPFTWGMAEGVVTYELLERLNTVGLWRLGGVAMLAYALARWRMPELAPRSRHAAATAMGIAGATVAGGLGVGLLILFTPSMPVLVLGALSIPLATVTPSVRLARRALSVRRETDTSEVTLSRRLETYRAALEASLARNSVKEDERFLAGLRDRLAIGEDVHEALLVIARDTVLPPPDEAHPGYERLRLLGEGGQGRAWLARRRADDTLIVIKEPREWSEENRKALAAQAKIAQRVRHPNLVHIHHAVHSPRASFLVMDHMPGGSVADVLAHAPLTPPVAAQLALDALDGIAALHDAGYVHGDVKPSNILLNAHGRGVVCDYGLARASVADRTRTLAPVQGTLAAMAPEQLDGAPATPSSDIYAAGALLYRLLTGEHYVSLTGLDETRARERVARAAPSLPHPRVPPALEAVIRRALAKDPRERYPSAHAMREALDEAASRL